MSLIHTLFFLTFTGSLVGPQCVSPQTLTPVRSIRVYTNSIYTQVWIYSTLIHI